jgi:hypothetical protein
LILPENDRETPFSKVTTFEYTTATSDAVVIALIEAGTFTIRGRAEDLASIEKASAHQEESSRKGNSFPSMGQWTLTGILNVHNTNHP